ncbi:MAG: zinc-binding alcohol dehydrogenase family protein [Actinomycetota bacterium]|nr:zinc-binding alcohol dehydrogenase family protein [Actinomycetota bacterium]
MATNRAAWIRSRGSKLEVGEAKFSPPQNNQILIRNHAIAINPLDWIIQIAGGFMYRWLAYPTVLGSDVAGEVIEVGSEVTNFSVGDRVIGHAVGSDKDSNNPSEGGFQNYTAVLAHMASRIPDFTPYESAVVIPLGLSTASCALYQRDLLNLELPSSNPPSRDETILIWGGSSSVGSNAIQLAVASGYRVVTTASPKNFNYVTSIGASSVFDHRAPNVIGEIINALQGKDLAGAIAIGETGATSCVRIMARCSGKRFVAIATPPVSFTNLAASTKSPTNTAIFVTRLVGTNVKLWIDAKRKGVDFKYIFGSALKNNEVADAIYGDFLPQALCEGRYIPAPPARVVGEGLEKIQYAIDLAKDGVSAEKIVVKVV